MRGNKVNNTAGFTVLRELTATDLKGRMQLLYESGLCEMEWGTAFFFMNRANKKEGACLYNKYIEHPSARNL